MRRLILVLHAAVLISGDYDSKTGVFKSNSSDFDEEIAQIGALLRLAPGMTYCEMGGGNGKFMVPLGKQVMPGGKVVVTEVVNNSLAVMETAARNAGFEASAVLANDTWLGMPDNTCDVIFSRMVYHMINETVAVGTYLWQLRQALKQGGHMLILDHNPDNGATTRVNASLKGKMDHRMRVVPIMQEIREFTKAGFALTQMLEWPFFHYGYGLMWIHAVPRSQDTKELPISKSGLVDVHVSPELSAIGNLNRVASTSMVLTAISSAVSCSIVCLVLSLTRKISRVQSKGGPVSANDFD